MLYASTLLGTFLNFVASVVNTNNLPPNEYGDVRYVQNLIQFFSWILLFGYFLSGSRLLALTDDLQRRRRIRGGLVMILGVTVVLLALSTTVVGLFFGNNPALSRLFFLSIPVSMYPLLINYFNTVAQGDNHIGRLSLARCLPPLLYVPLAWWIYASYGATPTRMMLLQWGLYSLVIVLLVASTRPSFKGLKEIFADIQRENRSYGIRLYVGSLAMVATTYIAGVMLGHFNLDNSVVAYYTLALTLTTPLSYLPGIIGTTYFRQFATQKVIPRKVLWATLLLTVISCVVYIIAIRPLVSWFYPDTYSSVAVYASWLGVGFCIHGIGDMFNRFLGSHGQGLAIRNSSFACGIFKTAGFIGLVWLMGVEGAIITHVIGSAIYTVCLCFYYLRFVRQKNDTISDVQ